MQNGTANNQYDYIPIHTPDYSTFDLSHEVKMSMKMGTLNPCLTQEVLPGDKWRMSQQAMFRMMPMVAPIMHKVQIFFHFFFVPNRLNWSNWREYITGGETFTGSGTPPAHPVLADWGGQIGPIEESTLANYLGLPVSNPAGSAFNETINALPFAAYQRIWHEYYRDENLQLPNTEPYVCIDGDQDPSDYAYLATLRSRAWEHDRYTSCLPWAQKGDPVEIPIAGSNIPVRLDSNSPMLLDPAFVDDPTAPTMYLDAYLKSNVATGVVEAQQAGGPNLGPGFYDPGDSLIADISAVVATNINDLRTAYAAQRWQELNARGGGRYIEALQIHFGVKSSDARLQRPEFIGGSKATMAISEVLQTGQSDATPQGNMAGHGISLTGGDHMSYRAEEHGFIIGIISILPTTTYYQGIPKFFTKGDKFSYAFPSLAHLGEEEVKNKEVFFKNDPTYDEGTFGYLPRYYEYRDQPNRVAGQMATSLEHWHMGRKFSLGAPPALNESFVVSDPTRRIFAVTTDDDKIIAHIFHNISVTRALPRYGEPGSIG